MHFTQNTYITGVSRYFHAHVDFHLLQHLSRITFVLMAKLIMPKLKGF
jgi:hypothetical protein